MCKNTQYHLSTTMNFFVVAETTSGDADDEVLATPILFTDADGELSENFSKPTLRTVAPVIEFSS